MSFIEFLMECCICDEIFGRILSKNKKLLLFKVSNGLNFKTGFLKPGHKYYIIF